MDKVFMRRLVFVVLVVKNEPFSICNGFSKIACHMSPGNNKVAKKYGAAKTKTHKLKKLRRISFRF